MSCVVLSCVVCCVVHCVCMLVLHAVVHAAAAHSAAHGFRGDVRNCKGAILTQSVSYIKQLQRENMEKQKVKEQNKAISETNKQLMLQIGVSIFFVLHRQYMFHNRSGYVALMPHPILFFRVKYVLTNMFQK